MSLDCKLISDDPAAIPVRPIFKDRWAIEAEALAPSDRSFASALGFEAKAGQLLPLPDGKGGVARFLFGLGAPTSSPADAFAVGQLATTLPPGTYRLEGPALDSELSYLAWLLGSYRFTRYRDRNERPMGLCAPSGIDQAEVTRIAEAVALGRDLINTPPNDLGPAELEEAARDLAGRHGAAISSIVGDELLAANFPMIHAVGSGSDRPPRLIDMTWGRAEDPRVTVVGKGVTFDTGGLNIKPDAAMLLMKKDMGGAAAALALADLAMGAGLPIRLRVLIPCVENMISGRSFRPGDVLPSRKGLSVEIGNTDAEGRLILADALALADEEAPDLVLDFATLTGAARVALGPDLPPLFTDDEALAADLLRLGEAVADPVWRLPLWRPYARLLDSKVADINHISGGPFAGSITAALFLKRFLTAARAHAHFDVYAWNPSTKPGRPEGGEVQVARLAYALLKERYRSSRA